MGRIIERIVAYEVWGDNDIGFSKQLNEGELLVRCKECKHREEYPCKVYHDDDWFCADGEREGE